MAKIVWIASYPRSGNTWLRFLLGNLLFKPIESSAELSQFIPDIHRSINAGQLHGPRTTLIKTHWRHHAALPLREDTVGVIYILRNPLDVLASNINYALLRSGEFMVRASAEARTAKVSKLIEDFIRHGGDPQWIKHGMGAWDENVASWTGNALPFPRLVLRYEDLKADTGRHAAEFCRFLGVERSEAQRADAVARSSFAAMRALEEQEIAERRDGFFYAPSSTAAHAEGLRFVNRGEVGSGSILLTAAQQQAAAARFAEPMKHFGYL